MAIFSSSILASSMSLGFGRLTGGFEISQHIAKITLPITIEIDIAVHMKYITLRLCSLLVILVTSANSSLFACMSIVENWSMQSFIVSAIFARLSVFLKTRLCREEI